MFPRYKSERTLVMATVLASLILLSPTWPGGWPQGPQLEGRRTGAAGNPGEELIGPTRVGCLLLVQSAMARGWSHMLSIQQGLGACFLNCRCPSWFKRTGRAGEGVQGVGGILLLTVSV